MSGPTVPGVQQQLATVGPSFEAEGKLWRMGFNCQDAKQRLEDLIRGDVIRDYLRMERLLGVPDGPAYRAGREALLDRGHFDTFGEGWTNTLGSVDGTILFVTSLLQEYHPAVAPADARRLYLAEPDQVKAALVRVAPDFFRAVLLQMGARAGPDLDAEVAKIVAQAEEMWGTPAPATASGSSTPTA